MRKKAGTFFWIPGGRSTEAATECRSYLEDPLSNLCAPLCEHTEEKYPNIRSVSLFRAHGGNRGPQQCCPVSSVGTLPNGEQYFIYRFASFWDGFQFQSGSQASGEGLYMLCLKLPLQSRATPNAVRILSLIPPGVKTADILPRILPDIIEGMTNGYMDVDGDGNRRRIFLDLVGCLGDTPALNSVLDVLGHTAAACCHLCRFSRASSTFVGSRYSGSGTNSVLASYRRGFLEHAALHDCNATRETCRLLGVRANPDSAGLPLHLFRTAILQARSSVPVTVDGQALLPHRFDPYRGCFIAPDHLLTGHLRDVINLAFRLLPSAACRKTVERVMLSFLVEAGLPSQNRLFDHDKKALYTMSMTQLYAIAMVAELAFAKGVDLSITCITSTSTLSPKFISAINLIGSCAELITTIWLKPDISRDGQVAAEIILENNGQTYIEFVQQCVQRHIHKVRDLCSMQDSDVSALDSDLTVSERSRLSHMHRDCLLAIKTIDKPNVHRLWEMAYSTLPLFGHMSCIGELVLEKTHQSLKRVIKRSNNRDVHIQCMESIAFDDWQGRLGPVVHGVREGDPTSCLHFYRLLSGREAVIKIGGVLPNELKTKVQAALGSGICIETELQAQQKSVISARISTSSQNWSFRGPTRAMSGSTTPTENAMQSLFSTLKIAFRSQLPELTITFGNELATSKNAGAPGPAFRHGDVVETLCCQPTDINCHYPFIIQTNCCSYLGALAAVSAPTNWIVENTFAVADKLMKTTYFLGVRPCLQTEVHFKHTRLHYDLQKYRADASGRVSLAKLDVSMRKVGVIADFENENAHASGQIVPEFFIINRARGYPGRKG